MWLSFSYNSSTVFGGFLFFFISTVTQLNEVMQSMVWYVFHCRALFQTKFVQQLEKQNKTKNVQKPAKEFTVGLWFIANPGA